MSVDVGEASRGSIVCGAQQLRRRRPGRRRPARRVLPGGFAITARKTYGHVSRRHDLLGARAGHRRRPRRHPRAAAGAREASGQPTRSSCSGCATRCSTSRSPPTAATALSMRGIAREAAHGLRRCRSATRPTLDRPADDRPAYPVVDRRTRSAATGSSCATVTGLDPAAAQPAVDARRGSAARHAADLAGRRHHQLRDARARPAAARLRPRAAPGPIVVRRARPGEKLRPSTAP